MTVIQQKAPSASLAREEGGRRRRQMRHCDESNVPGWMLLEWSCPALSTNCGFGRHSGRRGGIASLPLRAGSCDNRPALSDGRGNGRVGSF